MRVTREASAPPLDHRTWAERWERRDQGLFVCWERGREKAREDPDLAARASDGELVVLPWKGGVERAIKVGQKIGTLYYLAMWQGLRGESLSVALDEEVTLTCAKTGVRVTYTPDASKYSNA
jgi:hypothetical protein